jgi:hypothetical protein
MEFPAAHELRWGVVTVTKPVFATVGAIDVMG